MTPLLAGFLRFGGLRLLRAVKPARHVAQLDVPIGELGGADLVATRRAFEIDSSVLVSTDPVRIAGERLTWIDATDFATGRTLCEEDRVSSLSRGRTCTRPLKQPGRHS